MVKTSIHFLPVINNFKKNYVAARRSVKKIILRSKEQAEIYASSKFYFAIKTKDQICTKKLNNQTFSKKKKKKKLTTNNNKKMLMLIATLER